MIFLKTPEQINIMHEANCIVHSALQAVERQIVVGISTLELDKIAYDKITELGAVPTFLGYSGFPSSLCISINEEVVHGIPNKNRIIKNGDVVSIDIGATYKGFVGDSAKTIIVGDAPKNIKDLVNNTRVALFEGIGQMRIGKTLYDVCGAIESVAKTNKYGNIKSFTGHGVGTKLHEEPRVPNYVEGTNIHLQEGLVLALEPMFTLGTDDVKILDDKWTVVTIDNSIAAHWELSVAVTKDGPRILGYTGEKNEYA